MRSAAEVKPGDNYRLAPVTQKCAQQVTAEMKSGQSRCEDLVLIKIKSELCLICLLSPYRETLAASITKIIPYGEIESSGIGSTSWMDLSWRAAERNGNGDFLTDLSQLC
jgi:hypothetical protein